MLSYPGILVAFSSRFLQRYHLKGINIYLDHMVKDQDMKATCVGFMYVKRIFSNDNARHYCNKLFVYKHVL